jgi:hypothetical protein
LKLAKLKANTGVQAAAAGGGPETDQLRQELQMAEAKIAKLTIASKSASDADELREKLSVAESKTVALQALLDKQKAGSGGVPTITVRICFFVSTFVFHLFKDE